MRITDTGGGRRITDWYEQEVLWNRGMGIKEQGTGNEGVDGNDKGRARRRCPAAPGRKGRL